MTPKGKRLRKARRQLVISSLVYYQGPFLDHGDHGFLYHCKLAPPQVQPLIVLHFIARHTLSDKFREEVKREIESRSRQTEGITA